MALKKLDAPQDVQDALPAVEAILQERFAGRRHIPDPVIGRMPVPEEGEEAYLYFVIAPPGLPQRETMQRAALALDKARERGAEALQDALVKSQIAAIVECVYYVSGMPAVKEKQDPRIVARDYLKDLRKEAGSLGDAFSVVSGAVLEMLQPQAATLGKL